MKSKEVGDTRSIGVSNFTPEHLSNIIDLSFFTPAVNQIELHPLLNQDELRQVHAQHSIVTEAYCPLGTGTLLENPAVTAVAGRPRQVPGTGADPLEHPTRQRGDPPRDRAPPGSRRTSTSSTSNSPAPRWTALSGLDDGTRFRPQSGQPDFRRLRT